MTITAIDADVISMPSKGGLPRLLARLSGPAAFWRSQHLASKPTALRLNNRRLSELYKVGRFDRRVPLSREVV